MESKYSGEDLSEVGFESIYEVSSLAVQLFDFIDMFKETALEYRDFKLENVLWDDKLQKLTMIDFGVINFKKRKNEYT